MLDTQGYTEYWFEGFVSNATPDTWNGFAVEIGMRTGANFLPFADSTGMTHLDLDFNEQTPAPLAQGPANSFSDVLHGHSIVEYYTGTQNANQSVTYFFHIDIPDHANAQLINDPSLLVRNPVTNAVIGYKFTLRWHSDASGPGGPAAGGGGNSSVSGRVFNDVNQNGLQDASDSGIQGLFVYLYDEADNLVGATQTDSIGRYDFSSLVEGSYYLVFEQPLDFSFSAQNVGENDDIDSDVDFAGVTALFSLLEDEVINNIDAGLFQQV